MSCGDIFLGLLAVLFPPIAVWVKAGICSLDSVLNILLCILGYIPGLLHAWYVIAKYPEDYDRLDDGDFEGGRVTYYYVSRDPMPNSSSGTAPPAAAGQPDGGRAQREIQRGASYGATSTNQAPSSNQQTRGEGQAGGSSNEEQNGEARPPPTYDEAIQGDNKVQRP